MPDELTYEQRAESLLWDLAHNNTLYNQDRKDPIQIVAEYLKAYEELAVEKFKAENAKLREAIK